MTDGHTGGPGRPTSGASPVTPPATPVEGPVVPTVSTTAGSRRDARTLDAGTDGPVDRSPAPGELAIVMAALMLGLLLMSVQLWLLTVALELYLGGHGRQVWLLALVSGLIFVGGLIVLNVLGRRPRVAR